MGLLDIFKRKTDASGSDGNPAPARPKKTPSYEQQRTVGRESLNPPAPCGFDLHDVEVERSRTIDPSTGDVISESETINLEYDNLRKVSNDIRSLVDAIGKFIDHDVPFVAMDRAANDLACLSKPCIIDDRILNTSLEIMPLTPTGKVKKHPIVIRIDYRRPSGDLICKLEYLQSGKLGKARIDFWLSGIGYEYKLSLDKDSRYIVTAASVCEDDCWVKVYPSQ